MTRLRFSLLVLSLSLASGCPGTSSVCDFPVVCVDHCGGTESIACGVCPAGTIRTSSCIDASTSDAAITDAAAHDAAAHDAATIDAATIDAATIDTGRVVDANVNDAAPPFCDRPGYPATSAATHEETAAVTAAVDAFMTETTVTATLDPSTAAVTSFSGPFPVTLDSSIADPCARALDAIQTFATNHAALMRLPVDMIMRACTYDSLFDADIVRLHGGTYEGRRLLGVDNDLVVHVTRSGTIRHWGGSYLPVAERLVATPCADIDALRASLIGSSLHYTIFHACVLSGSGSIAIGAGDTRHPSDSALFIDDAGLVHIARQVEVLLAPAHVGTEQVQSTLYCCSMASLDGCVGNFVVVDEITLEVLTEIPRCITC